MTLQKIEIESRVVQRGNSTYVLIPSVVASNCDLQPGDICKILFNNKKLEVIVA